MRSLADSRLHSTTPVLPGEKGKSAPLDVLIVCQPVSYGVATYVRQLTEAALTAGHRVTVACPGSEKGPLAGWVTTAGAKHEVLGMVRRPAFRDIMDVLMIRRLARGRDVVHFHSSKAAALGRMAVAWIRPPRPAVVVTPHYWPWFVGGKLATLYRLIERGLAPYCDAIVAVSEREVDEGRLVLGASADRIMLIHNGVDRDRYTPHGPRAERSVKFPLVVCVGRLSEQKGQDVAIRSLAMLRSDTARLRLVGGESKVGERLKMDELAKSLGVADRIEWRGHVLDAAPEMRAADIVVAPSRWEGMSLVLLEAMACGSAMVVTDVPGSEAVGDAAVVVPREDPRALAEAIDDLLDDPVRRQRLAYAARQRSASYELRSTLNRNLDLWEGLVRGRGTTSQSSSAGEQR